MPVIIRQNDSQLAAKVVVFIILVIVIALIVLAIWYYLVRPYMKGTLLPKAPVKCTAAPTTPLNVTVSLDKNRAYLSWTETANTDNYLLYMGISPNFDLALSDRVIKVTGPSVAVLNLLPYTYYFKLVAVNSCGQSALSQEVVLPVTAWPEKFKICKTDDPRVCLALENLNAPVFMSDVCAGTSCELTYVNNQNLKKPAADLCLFDTTVPGPEIEVPVSGKSCIAPPNWTINLTTGRITSTSGVCLGAETIPGSQAYNTECAVISNPDDARYAWTVQALTF